MALVQHRGRNAAFLAAMAGFLRERMARAGEDQIQRWAQEFVHDMEMGGRDAVEAVRSTVGEIMSSGSARIRGSAQNWAEQLQRGVVEFGQNFMQQFGDDDGDIPDLSDLIPQNPENEARVGDRRNRNGEVTNRRGERDIDMDGGGMDTGTEATAVARTAFSGGGANPVSKETPVTPAQASYALQETHTTTCQWTGWGSVVGPDHDTPIAVELRLTAPQDIMITNYATSPGAGGAWTKGWHIYPYNNSNTMNAAPLPEFPTVGSSGSFTSERANWFQYWAQIYEYYTVVSTHYKITMINNNSSTGGDIIVGVTMDAWSDTAGSTGNVTPEDAGFHEAKQWKNMRWELLEAEGGRGDPRPVILSGYYRPGQTRRNVSNDGDVKTWTKTDGSLPTLKETMKMLFYKAPMAWRQQVVGTSGTYGCNVQIDVAYTVQFKDLKQQARYPRGAGTDISQTIDTHSAQIPNS